MSSRDCEGAPVKPPSSAPAALGAPPPDASSQTYPHLPPIAHSSGSQLGWACVGSAPISDGSRRTLSLTGAPPSYNPSIRDVAGSSLGFTGVSSSGQVFLPPPPSSASVTSTDASNLGWGAFLHPYHVSGLWSPQEARLHINSLELLAVFLALQSFEDLIFEQSIMIRSDNSTVVSYINHQGGTHSPSLCNLTLVLWDWCRERSIHLLASHVPGEDNLLADFLSRGKFLPSEWTLNHSVFQRICLIFPTPEIDLFASALTFQFPKYCSRVQDLQAWAIDAMSFPWSDLRLYAFPPFSLLPRVLQKVAQDEADLLIAPHWPQRPWFLRLLSLLVDFPRSLPPLPDLVHQPISLFPHPHPDRLHLSLWLLSGNVAKRQAFLRGLPNLLGHPPDALMTIDWQASLNGVPSLRVIRILPL